jgi:hypothetical protein
MMPSQKSTCAKYRAMKINYASYLLITCFIFLGCVNDPAEYQRRAGEIEQVRNLGDADKFFIVDCLLPGQIRKLGREAVYMTARIPIKTSALDCEEQGGEYVAYNQANKATALQYWLPAAQEGNAEAQVYVGEIFAKGQDTPPDYKSAAEWYRKAAAQGNSRARINLGYLYEKGLGVEKNLAAATELYKKASGFDKENLDYIATLSTTSDSAASPVVTGSHKPVIEIIDPPVSMVRGMPIVKIRSAVKERDIVGRVTDPSGITSLTVNNAQNALDAQGKFKSSISIKGDKTPISIVAINKEGGRQNLEFMLAVDDFLNGEPVEAASPLNVINPWKDLEFGNYYALVIGNSDYEKLPDLDTPDEDARAVNSILKSKYGFTTQLLINANRYQLLSALNELRTKLTENDNLLIYYAGHGELDKTNERGQWLPIDAEINNTSNWVSNIDVTDILNTMNAKHIIVVADSCYSGAMTRTAIPRIEAGLSQKQKFETVKVMIQTKSRTALTSGGEEQVMDGGGGGHSIFAKAVIDALQNNQGLLEAQQLFDTVSDVVIPVARANNISQTPEYAPIKNAGHDGGEFLFIAI